MINIVKRKVLRWLFVLPLSTNYMYSAQCVAEITDNFNRPNSEGQLGQTQTGENWSITKGKWKIESNQVAAYVDEIVEVNHKGWDKTHHIGAGDGDLLAVVPSASDGFVQVTLPEPGQWTGVVFRYKDTINYWKLAADVRGGRWILSRWLNGEQGGYHVIPQAPGNGDHIRVGYSLSNIRVFINGDEKLYIRDTTLQDGLGAGLLGYAGSTGHEPAGLAARFDDFSASQGLCGNGIIDNLEECDDGESNGLANFCNTTCGNYTRLARDWPFSSNSPFNRPIGSNAVYVDDPNVRMGSSWTINTLQWSRSLVSSSASDPLTNIYYNDHFHDSGPRYDGCALNYSSEVSVALNLPVGVTGANPQPPPGGSSCHRDGHMLVVEEDGQTLHEFYKFKRISDTLAYSKSRIWPTAHNNLVSGKGIGSHPNHIVGAQAYGGSGIAGVLRAWEVNDSGIDRIRHALSLGVNVNQLQRPNDSLDKSSTYKWPATSSDNHFATAYMGSIHMGELIALPNSVNIDNLDLSEDGKALAWTLQNFGGYITDAAGHSSGAFIIYADADSDGSKVRNMRNDMSKIVPLLRIVSNNTMNTIGGGGTYDSELWPPPDPVAF
jgi:hypothetical protein